MRRLVKAIDRFWFTPRSAESLAVWRICFGLYFLHILFISLPNWSRYYGVDGTYPLRILHAEGRDIWSVLSLSNSPEFIWWAYLSLVVAALFFTLGLFTRLATLVLFIGSSSMMSRNVYMVNGQDQVATLLLFFACFAPLNGAFSLDRKLWKKPQTGELQSGWAQRLMQVSFAGIYLFCGPTKLDTWANGEAFYYISLSHSWFRFPELASFRRIRISSFLSYSTIAIETLFPLLVWFRPTRSSILFFLALLHIGAMIFLSPAVFYFNAIMVISLLLFLDEKGIERRFRDYCRRREIRKQHCS